jgi:transcription-repair coupling factor (superfamily II helicase)
MLLRIANARVLSRNADIAKVDAGPSAIAFTSRNEMTKRAAAAAGLLPKNGRLLLEASIASPVDRLARIEKVLGLLSKGHKGA